MQKTGPLVLCFLINSVFCFLIHGEKGELEIKSQWICIISLPYDIDKLLAEIRLVAGLITRKFQKIYIIFTCNESVFS